MLIVLVISLFLGGQGGEPVSSAVGSICVAPLPKEAQRMDHDFPGGKARRQYTYQFTVQVDSQKPVDVGTETGVLIAELQTGEQHRVVIRDAGKVIESFSFTFEKRGSPHLCLAYGPWYQSWSLEPPQPGWRWCRCEPSSPAKGAA